MKALQVVEKIAAYKQQLRDLLGPEETAKYSKFKEEERQKEERAVQAKKPKDVSTTQPMGGPLTSPRGKPNPLVQRKKKGPYWVQESASSRSGPSRSTLKVRAPVVQDANGYWDSLGAFHDPWGGVYFKGYYYPLAGQTPYRATVLEDALNKIPQALRANFEAQQEALKIYVPDVEVAAQEW